MTDLHSKTSSGLHARDIHAKPKSVGTGDDSHMVRRSVLRDGFVFIPRYLRDESSDCVSMRLGKLSRMGRSKPVHSLSPARKSASTPNTYSGIYGLNGFPCHTDLAHWPWPPRFLMLRCATGSIDVSTLLLDGRDVIAGADANILSRALVQPRRPLQNTRPLMRIYRPGLGGFGLLRWDLEFIRPASPVGKQGVQLMQAELANAHPTKILLSDYGDTLLIDNWRMLHGRSPVSSADLNRKIDRAYLETLY